MKSELSQKVWAVVAHNAVYESDLCYEEAFALAKDLKTNRGISCAVVTNEAAGRMKVRAER